MSFWFLLAIERFIKVFMVFSRCFGSKWVEKGLKIWFGIERNLRVNFQFDVVDGASSTVFFEKKINGADDPLMKKSGPSPSTQAKS
jgi:hypothetical protein